MKNNSLAFVILNNKFEIPWRNIWLLPTVGRSGPPTATNSPPEVWAAFWRITTCHYLTTSPSLKITTSKHLANLWNFFCMINFWQFHLKTQRNFYVQINNLFLFLNRNWIFENKMPKPEKSEGKTFLAIQGKILSFILISSLNRMLNLIILMERMMF